MGYKMERLPVAPFTESVAAEVSSSVDTRISQSRMIALTTVAVLDWLRHEFGLEKPGTALAQPHLLDGDGFVVAVRKALPKSRKLSTADIARLKQEYAATIEPARHAANDALALERRLSDLVNAAYGLTPEDVALMWATAPPRMPFTPTEPS